MAKRNWSTERIPHRTWTRSTRITRMAETISPSQPRKSKTLENSQKIIYILTWIFNLCPYPITSMASNFLKNRENSSQKLNKTHKDNKNGRDHFTHPASLIKNPRKKNKNPFMYTHLNFNSLPSSNFLKETHQRVKGFLWILNAKTQQEKSKTLEKK